MTPPCFTDEQVIEQAKDCDTVQQLWHRLGWSDFQHVRAVNKRLRLNLPEIRKNRASVPRPAQPVPKPVGKGAKPAAKKAGGEE